MKDLENIEEQLICEKCNAILEDESDLLDYEDMTVCEYCLDEYRRLDEQVYQDLSSEGIDGYD